MMLTQERVRELFDYDPDIGKLIHTGANKHPKCKAGKIVEGTDAGQCLRVGFDKREYKYHRVVFLWLYGWLPELIDHVDRDYKNNRPDNLRPSDKSKNALNSDRSENRKNYTFAKTKGKWRAYRWEAGKQIHLGYHNTEEEARAASR